MAGCKEIRRRAAFTLAMALMATPLIAAPPASAHAQPAASRYAVRTRVLPWTGGDRLFVAMSADVRYVPGADARMVISGPAADIDDIVADGGVIRRERMGPAWDWRWWRWWDWGRRRAVHIVVTAPHVTEAGVTGSGHLDLGRLAQDRLDLGVTGSGAVETSGQFKSLSVGVMGSGSARLDHVNVGDMSARISGSGWIGAGGAANSLHLAITGSGGAEMGGLAVQDLDARLSGSGGAKLSPRRSADVAVFGSGMIRLLTEPARLNAHRAGSGAILHPGGVS